MKNEAELKAKLIRMSQAEANMKGYIKCMVYHFSELAQVAALLAINRDVIAENRIQSIISKFKQINP